MPSAYQKGMNTLHTDRLDVNPSCPLSANWRKGSRRPLTQLEALAADRRPLANPSGGLAGVKATQFQQCESTTALVKCERLTSQASDAALRLNLRREHIIAACYLAATGHQGIIDIATGVRVRVQSGVVRHIFRLRQPPSRVMHPVQCHSCALGLGPMGW